MAADPIPQMKTLNRYRYSIRSVDGRHLVGQLSAVNLDDATRLLHEAGAYVLNVQQIKTAARLSASGSVMINPEDLIFFLEAWVTFLESGVSLQSSLMRLRMKLGNKDLTAGLDRMQEALDAGEPLGSALKKSRLFPLSWIAILESAQKHGDIASPLRILHKLAMSSLRFKRSLHSMMVMPLILLILIGVWLWVFLDRIIPQIIELMTIAGTPQVAPYIQMLGPTAEGILKGIQWFIFFCICGFLLSKAARKADQEEGFFQAWTPLWVPVVGPVIAKFQFILIASSLKLQLDAGIPFIEALETVARSVTNRSVRRDLAQAVADLRAGTRINRALEKVRVIPFVAQEMLAVGSESGKIPEMLEVIIREAEEELVHYLYRLLILVEVFVLLVTAVLAAIVAYIYYGIIFSAIRGWEEAPGQLKTIKDLDAAR